MLQYDFSGVQKELCGLSDHKVRLCAPLWHRVWNLYLYEQVCQKSTVLGWRSYLTPLNSHVDLFPGSVLTQFSWQPNMSQPMESLGSTGRDRCFETWAKSKDKRQCNRIYHQVLSVSMDEENVVPYIQGTLNNNDLALRMAVRWFCLMRISHKERTSKMSITTNLEKSLIKCHCHQEQPVRSWPAVCHKV